MSKIFAISGSPSPRSRTALVLKHLATRLGPEVEVDLASVRDLPSEALLGADPSHPAVLDIANRIDDADGLIVATPVYKAAYSGVLKALLDLLPQRALTGKVVLPLATGGTLAHVLAVDYTLRPVLTALGAAHVVPGYFLFDTWINERDGVVSLESTAEAAISGVLTTFLDALRTATSARVSASAV